MKKALSLALVGAGLGMTAKADILLSSMYSALDMGGGIYEYALLVGTDLPLEGGLGNFTLFDLDGYIPGSVTWNDFAGVVWDLTETQNSISGPNNTLLWDIDANFDFVGNPLPAGPGDLGYLTFQSYSSVPADIRFYRFAIQQDPSGDVSLTDGEGVIRLTETGAEVPEASTVIPAAVLGVGMIGMYLRRRAAAA